MTTDIVNFLENLMNNAENGNVVSWYIILIVMALVVGIGFSIWSGLWTGVMKLILRKARKSYRIRKRISAIAQLLEEED